MKRFLSILIVLALMVSLFAVGAVAFAEDSHDEETGPSHKVTFNFDKFKQYVLDVDRDYYLEMDSKFMLNNKWWQDAAKVQEIFTGINYRVQPAEDIKDEDGNEKTEPKYTVHYAEYDATKTDDTAPSDESWLETRHFDLPRAPQAKLNEPAEEGAEGTPVAYFAGWKIEATEPSNELPVCLQGTFAAGATIAMPAFDITVTGVWKETEEEAKDEVKPDDVIWLLYVSPSGSVTDDMDNWSRQRVTSSINLASEGEWNFRFAVVDGAKVAASSDYTFKYDDVLTTTYAEVEKLIEQADAEGTTVDDAAAEAVNGTLTYYVQDTTAPKAELSASQIKTTDEGLTVGTAYSISTSLDVTDCSSYDVTYIVYKKVGTAVVGADSEGWLQIYDSKKAEVAEGYENNITTGGVITPLDEDVTGDSVYKIVYTVVDRVSGKQAVKDTLGNAETTEEYHPTMLLKVKANPDDASAAASVNVWKIVLYVIAGLSAVGIIVLLFVKPKQVKADARYNSNAVNADAQSAAPQDDASDDQDDQADKEE